MKKVAIIGGGIAGTACAYALKNGGAEPVIYEAGDNLASATSANPLGLYNPKLTAHRTPQSDYFVAGFSMTEHTFKVLDDIDWSPCGSLHLITDEKKEKRFPQTLENWRWDPDHMRLLNAKQASEIAGVEVRHEALYLPDAGFVSPRKLCHAYARDIEVKYNTRVENLSDIEADAVILASAMGVFGMLLLIVSLFLAGRFLGRRMGELFRA